MTAPGVLLGDRISSGHAMVQAAGSAWRVPADILQRLAESDVLLRRHLLRQAGMALRQLADTVVLQRSRDDRRTARALAAAGDLSPGRPPARSHARRAGRDPRRAPAEHHDGLQTLEGRHLIRSTRRAIVVLDTEGLAEWRGVDRGVSSRPYKIVVGCNCRCDHGIYTTCKRTTTHDRSCCANFPCCVRWAPAAGPSATAPTRGARR